MVVYFWVQSTDRPEPAPERLVELLGLVRPALAELDEVAPRDRHLLLRVRLLRRGEVGVVGQRRVAPARRSRAAPGARSAARCRPSPSGRRPRGRASAGTGRSRRCGCRRRRGRRAGCRSRSAAGCRSRRPARGSWSGRRGRCPAPAIPAAQRSSRPSTVGLSGTRASRVPGVSRGGLGRLLVHGRRSYGRPAACPPPEFPWRSALGLRRSVDSGVERDEALTPYGLARTVRAGASWPGRPSTTSTRRWTGSASCSTCSARRSGRAPVDPRRRHQRQDLDHPDDRRAAARVRPAHRPVHQPAPALDARADRLRRPADRRRSGSSRPTTTSRPTSTWSTPGTRCRLSFFEVLDRRWRSPPSPTRRSTSRSSRSASAAPGTPPTSPTARSPSSPRSASTTPGSSAHTIEEIAGEKAGIIKPGAYGVLGPAAGRGRRGAAAPVGRGRRHRGARGPGVRRPVAHPRRRRPAADLRGLAGEYDDVFLPLLGAHQAHNAGCALAAVEAFLGGAHAERGRLDLDLVRAGVRRRDLAGPARGGPQPRRRCVLDAAHNPAGARGDRAGAARGRSASPGWSGVVAAMADKDVRGILEAFEPVLAEVVVTQSTSGPVDAGRRAGCGRRRGLRRRPGRGRAPRLDDALDAAVALAEEEGDHLGGSGVLVTGSIVTVGEARPCSAGLSAPTPL